MAEGLHALFNSPADGFTKTRDPRLDPPVRVTGVYMKSFGLTPSCPERWPEEPPQDSKRFFLVDLAVYRRRGRRVRRRASAVHALCGESGWA